MNFVLFLCEGTHWIAKVIENIPNAEITLTSPIELGDISKFEELKMCCKRRVIPTHLSYNMLPVDIKQKQCKVRVGAWEYHKTELGFLLCHFQAVWPWKIADALWALVSSFDTGIMVSVSHSNVKIK